MSSKVFERMAESIQQNLQLGDVFTARVMDVEDRRDSFTITYKLPGFISLNGTHLRKSSLAVDYDVVAQATGQDVEIKRVNGGEIKFFKVQGVEFLKAAP